MHVAELAQEVADERLGLDLERRDLRGVGDLGGLPGHDGPAREVPFVEVVARAAQQAEADRARRAGASHQAAKRLEVPEALAPPAEHAVRALERLVAVDAPRVLGGQVRKGPLVVPDGERRLVAGAGGVGGLEVEVGGAVVALAAGQVSGHDRGREAARQRRSARCSPSSRCMRTRSVGSSAA